MSPQKDVTGYLEKKIPKIRESEKERERERKREVFRANFFRTQSFQQCM
jgi:hypothetical protein